MDDFINIPQKGMTMLFGENDCNSVKIILIDLIDDFPNHPYPVHDDDALIELQNSIAKNGQLEPAIVRALGNGRYQMLSGHRRKLAHIKLGYRDMRAIVLENITEDQAKVIMLDCNERREELLPSEKARIYYEKKQLYQTMDRTELLDLSEMFGSPSLRPVAVVAKRSEDSEGQIKRYIRLHTKASEELKLMVDTGEMSLRIADELTALPVKAQNIICSILKEHGRRLSYEQAVQLKQLEDITGDAVLAALGLSARKPISSEPLRLSSKKIRSYFPENYSAGQIQEVIYGLLEEWRQKGDSAL